MLVIWEDIVPLIRNEHMVNAFQSQMSLLIAPSEVSSVKMNLLKHAIVEKLAELSHAPTIQSIIVLIFDVINLVEIPVDHPWARPDLV
jgi:hypothetical protein